MCKINHSAFNLCRLKIEKMSKGPMCNVSDYEEFALSVLPKSTADYYKSGAENEYSLNQNRQAFQRLRLRPRMLVDVSQLSCSTKVFGEEVAIPIGIAPTAMQKMAHPSGECANAKAAGAMGTIFTLSTISTSSIEEVAEAAPDTVKWFQLYIYKDREVTKKLVQRAERSGFKALVLTVDAPIFGIRYADERNRFSLPPHLRLANFSDDKATKVTEARDDQSSLNAYVFSLLDQKLTWKDIKWLKSITRLPIVLKGILTAEDAIIAADLGVEAIQVSNHGARQLDTVPAAIEALPEIVKAVGDRCEIFFDGGVRSGTDVFKAVALGAKMVFVGRPALWGLAHSGQQGVEHILKILKKELITSMTLTGCTSLATISKSMVVHENYYSRL
ncbi:peroxisomal (S)-2-hydroxy-acid oxidase GLO3 isoform X1 [Homalodisca vitripennis]|uniref:peroxisomal (S)-2-hydroxy-acid oxidase GLO3 isoform X1 n=2 Tax=Homalodisca vitripennis TaxID=197043 RepID=UPI001EEAA58E|nr:peroxisomal (S)-2-hydroxy-acid oxidase GLO3 isoform X1 [Homalodisca vitripennis]